MAKWAVGTRHGALRVIEAKPELRTVDDPVHGTQQQFGDIHLRLACVCGGIVHWWVGDIAKRKADVDRDCGCSVGKGMNTGPGRPKMAISERKIPITITLCAGTVIELDRIARTDMGMSLSGLMQQISEQYLATWQGKLPGR